MNTLIMALNFLVDGSEFSRRDQVLSNALKEVSFAISFNFEATECFDDVPLTARNPTKE